MALAFEIGIIIENQLRSKMNKLNFNAALFLLLAALCSPAIFAKETYKIKNAEVFIYSAQVDGVKKAVLSPGEEVALLEKGSNRSKIKASGGTVGWVLNSDMVSVVESKGDFYDLQELEVNGWLDNPRVLYILDEGNLEMEGMLLTRNWDVEIYEFIDRETLERANDEN